MAKKFNSLKDPKLHLPDKLPFGKYQNCRIVDLLPDSWEYLMWLSKNTSVQFGQDVLDKITEHFTAEAEARFIDEEVKPWQSQSPFFSDWDDDVPF